MFSFLFGVWLNWVLESSKERIAALILKVRTWLG